MVPPDCLRTATLLRRSQRLRVREPIRYTQFRGHNPSRLSHAIGIFDTTTRGWLDYVGYGVVRSTSSLGRCSTNGTFPQTSLRQAEDAAGLISSSPSFLLLFGGSAPKSPRILRPSLDGTKISDR